VPDPEQIQALIVNALMIALLAAPFVGLQRAAVRRRLKQRSTRAVVFASVGTLAAMALCALLLHDVSAALELLGPLGLVVANAAWLVFTVHTNSEVARRLAASADSSKA